MDSYKTVYRGGQSEIEEKKSRFIANVWPVSTEEEALAFLTKTKKQYWDARHNCFAYTIGRNHELQRFSDDGEPGGTAGRPMLDVLVKEDIHNCIVVVTRYFGGTLLGTGGLVRAYQKSTQEGLANSTIIERKSGKQITISTDYNGIGKIQYLIAKDGITIMDSRYTDTVELDVMISEEIFASFCAEVTESTSGRAGLSSGDSVEFAVIDGEVLLFS
jgi:uncharacterized YigZ family protein